VSLTNDYRLPTHDCLSAFFCIGFNSRNNLFTGKFLEIPQYITQIIISCGYDQVDMITHNTPTVNYKTLFPLTKPDTIQQYIPIVFSGKNVNPRHNSKCDKMNRCLIPDFVSAFTHACQF